MSHNDTFRPKMLSNVKVRMVFHHAKSSRIEASFQFLEKNLLSLLNVTFLSFRAQQNNAHTPLIIRLLHSALTVSRHRCLLRHRPRHLSNSHQTRSTCRRYGSQSRGTFPASIGGAHRRLRGCRFNFLDYHERDLRRCHVDENRRPREGIASLSIGSKCRSDNSRRAHRRS